MKVLVDTTVWSLALRRKKGFESSQAWLLRELIKDSRAVLIGAIRQEILSGIRDRAQYESLKARLRSFPDIQLDLQDYELAADFCNICRQNGIQGSNTDFLICAVANRRDHAILTTDRDFDHFSQHLPIRLLNSSEE